MGVGTQSRIGAGKKENIRRGVGEVHAPKKALTAPTIERIPVISPPECLRWEKNA